MTVSAGAVIYVEPDLMWAILPRAENTVIFLEERPLVADWSVTTWHKRTCSSGRARYVVLGAPLAGHA